MFNELAPGLKASFFLLAANDVVSQIARDETYHSPEDGAQYNGNFRKAWSAALAGFREEGQFVTLDDAMEAAVSAAIDRLSTFSFLSDEAAFLKARRLDHALEAAPARPKPRM